MSDKSNNDFKTTPVHDLKSLLPSTNTKEKRPARPDSMEEEIGAELTEGKISPDELNSLNDN
ncbi:MAG TPA: hypothetical protein VK950_04700 [Methylophilus sp.]|jgi:hypothetical protein|nr:hypothetical protein [Methylophilus sp.]